MLNKNKKIFLITSAVIICLCLLVGCSNGQNSNSNSTPNGDISNSDASENGSQLTDDYIDEDEAPADKNLGQTKKTWEGLFERDDESGKIAIKNVDINSFEFIYVNSSGVSTFAGIAEIDENIAVYFEEEFAITMEINGDSITVTKEPSSDEDDISGTFVRTDSDPYSVPEPEIDRENGDGKTDAFSHISKTTIDGATALVYIDPQNRFSAVLPDIFATAPGEAQPFDGIYLQTEDGKAHIAVEASSQETDTPNSLAEYLLSQYEGGMAETLENGIIRFEYSFTDGNGDPWTEIMYISSADGLLVKVDFVFDKTQYDNFAPLVDRIEISMG